LNEEDDEMKDRTRGIPMVVVAVLFCAGCQQPEAPKEKQARLFAAQNRDLQQQLAAREAEVQALQRKHALELRQRDQELAHCKVRIEALQKDLEKGIDERVNSVTKSVIDENAKLRREIEQLKAQLEQLKAASAKEGSS
jgi:hypothetical protein